MIKWIEEKLHFLKTKMLKLFHNRENKIRAGTTPYFCIKMYAVKEIIFVFVHFKA